MTRRRAWLVALLAGLAVGACAGGGGGGGDDGGGDDGDDATTTRAGGGSTGGGQGSSSDGDTPHGPVFIVRPGRFGDTRVGEADTKQITITNASEEPQEVEEVEVGGGDPRDFQIAGNECAGTTLQPGQSCTVRVTFKPAAAGERSATVEVVPTEGQKTAAPVEGTGAQAEPQSTDSGG